MKPLDVVPLPLFPEGAPSDLALLGMPEPMQPRRELKWFDDVPGADEVGAVLSAVLGALESYRPGEPTRVLALEGLSPAARRLLDETLGEGEVTATVQGARRWELTESSLVGVWRLEAFDGDGTRLGTWLEVAGLPSAIDAANRQGTATDVSIGTVPAGAMNVLPVLAELRHHVAAYQPASAPHVVNLSLLPMNEIDMAHLEAQLGHGPVLAESRGYGRCKVQLTGHRNLWSVQFFNTMGVLILDTLEVADVPSSLAAAPEDFEESARRLGELLEAKA